MLDILEPPWRLSPQIGTIFIGSGFAGGIRYNSKFIESSAALSVRMYQQYDFQIGLKPKPPRGSLFLKPYRPWDVFQLAEIDEPGLFVYADLGYRHSPEEDFYGIGPESKETDRTDFKLTEASYHAVSGYQFGKTLRLDFRAGLLQPEIGRGTDDAFPDATDLFDEDSARGLFQQDNYLRISFSILVDYRDAPPHPYARGAVGFSFTRVEGLGSSNFDFNRLVLDLRYFFPIPGSGHALPIRLFISNDSVDERSHVPFFLQETLGGTDTLRGFPDYRFRDTNLFYSSVEYRRDLNSFLQLGFFYDTGKVYSNEFGFGSANLENSYGFGVRIIQEEKVVFRIDLARSGENNRIILRMEPAF